MPGRVALVLLVCLCATNLPSQDFTGIKVHGFLTQGFVYSSNNNYLSMETSDGSVRWTDGAVSVSDSVTDKLRVGIQLHMYQLGEIGGDHLQIDWASADYRFNDRFGIRAGKVKTVIGLFNDSQDIDAIFLWSLLPQSVYPIDDRSFFLSNLGGEIYGEWPLGHRAGAVEYSGFAGYQYFDLHGGFAKTLADNGLPFKTAPAGKTYGGDLRWKTPLKGMLVGSSENVKTVDGRTSNGGNFHLIPFLFSVQYAQFTRGRFFLAGEYERVPVNAILSFGPVALTDQYAYRSWYAMGSYRVSKKLRVGSYYSQYLTTAQNTRLPANYSKDRVLSGRYDFNSYFYGKIEEHFLRGTNLGYYASTNPAGLRPDSNILVLKIGFSF